MNFFFAWGPQHPGYGTVNSVRVSLSFAHEMLTNTSMDKIKKITEKKKRKHKQLFCLRKENTDKSYLLTK